MNKALIIVSGKNGQLGREVQALVFLYPQFHFAFYSKDELDISDNEKLQQHFHLNKPSFFINCAAYTAVDKAETDKENAYRINAEAVGNLATICKEHKTKLIHFSTDYVFDGTANQPYKEDDKTSAVNYYGYTKLMGERLALQNNPDTTIIRTSWVYSCYGNNFVKTMLKLMSERKELNIVNDQVGSPTYAKDLAKAVLLIVSSQTSFKGIYNFSNDGIITWFDFACAIKEINNFNCTINPIPTSAFTTPAKRPAYSVMSKEKIKDELSISLKDWKESLKECLNKFQTVI